MCTSRPNKKLDDDEVLEAARRIGNNESHSSVARAFGVVRSILTERLAKLAAQPVAEAKGADVE